MKLKGVNPIEQHVEKFVLGGVCLVFLGVVAAQLLGGGTKVTIDGKKYPLDQAYSPIEQKAASVDMRMKEPAPSVLPEVQPLGLLPQWQALGSTPVAPAPVQLALAPVRGPSAAMTIATDSGPVVASEFQYPQINVEAPSRPRAIVHRNTIDPYAVASSRDIEALLRNQGLTGQPWDATGVTVEVKFDGAALAAQLATDPDGQGTRMAAIPTDWWRGNVEILAVEFERCAGFDDAGNPIDPAPLAPIPGRENLLSQIPAENPTVEQVQRVIELAGMEMQYVLQPRYLPVIAGEPWRSPSEVERLEEIEARRPEIDRKVRQYRSAQEALERAQQALDEARGPRGPGGPGGPGPRNPNSPTGPGGEPPRAPTGPDDATIRTLEQRVVRAQGDLDAIVSDLRAIGVDETGKVLEPDETDQALEFLDDMLETHDMRMWTHDLAVTPGSTYAYRARVVINNPLFGFGKSLSDEQKPLAGVPTLASEWSEWSEPVQIDLNEYYFLTSAVEGSIDNLPRANVDVFKFYYGYWRRGTASLEPGDKIATRVALPSPELIPQFTLTAAPPPSGTPPTQPGGPGRGTGGPSVMQPEQPSRGTQTISTANATPGPQELFVTVDAWLLDVGVVPGSQDPNNPVSRVKLQAFLRGPVGTVDVRPTGEDLGNERYKRLVRSAKEGEDQGAPEPEPEPKPERLPDRPREREREYQPPPGGGGGGGGGG